MAHIRNDSPPMFRVMEDAPTFMAAGAGAANLVEFKDETNTLVGSVDPDGNVTVSGLAVNGTVTVGTWQGSAIGIAYGGTGATTAPGARTALGLVIGTDVQAYSATLAAVAGGTYTGATSITTLGTVSSGTWQGSTIASTYLAAGSTSAVGVVQLSDSTVSTSTSLAATANSVRQGDRDSFVRLSMEVF